MTDWVRQVLERYGQDVTVDTAERLMAPFAVPDDFCFRGVRG